MEDSFSQDYCALLIIKQSELPVGSGYLGRELKKHGLQISEATAGRILARYDRLGYTARIGFQGRSLTELGREKLKELEAKEITNHNLLELVRLLDRKTPTAQQEILVVRKVIERELARLAAIYATPQEIRELGAMAYSQKERVVQDNFEVVKQRVAFHRLLCKAAHNKILEGLRELVCPEQLFWASVEYRCKEDWSQIVEEHIKIAQAIESHDPAQAEEAMKVHMENMS